MNDNTNDNEFKNLITIYFKRFGPTLTAEQVEIGVNFVMLTPGKWLPDTLHETLTNVSARVGMSGDVIADTAREWLRHGASKVLTYEELWG